MRLNIRIKDENEVRQFINTTNTFRSPIDLISGSHVVDAKSILGVVALGLYKEFEVEIITNDKDEFNEFIKEMNQYAIY